MPIKLPAWYNNTPWKQQNRPYA